MTAKQRIEDLTKRHMLGRNGDVVQFTDELLTIVEEVGELHCVYAQPNTLRFSIPSHGTTFDVMLESTAKGRLRSVCAHLGVRSKESGHEVSLYGGEGVIVKAEPNLSPADLKNPVFPQPIAVMSGARLGDPNSMPKAESQTLRASERKCDENHALSANLRKWAVRFKNTMAEQEFTISAVR